MSSKQSEVNNYLLNTNANNNNNSNNNRYLGSSRQSTKRLSRAITLHEPYTVTTEQMQHCMP